MSSSYDPEGTADAVSQSSTGWQPIETAPKDRGEILGFWRDSTGMPVRKVIEYVRCLNSEYDEGWTAYQVESWNYEEYAYETPTHWMPLPPPPQRTNT